MDDLCGKHLTSGVPSAVAGEPPSLSVGGPWIWHLETFSRVCLLLFQGCFLLVPSLLHRGYSVAANLLGSGCPGSRYPLSGQPPAPLCLCAPAKPPCTSFPRWRNFLCSAAWETYLLSCKGWKVSWYLVFRFMPHHGPSLIPGSPNSWATLGFAGGFDFFLHFA